MPLLRPNLLRIRATRLLTIPRRFNSTEQPPSTPKANRHGGFYKEYGPTVIKNFLIALCTYQALYWSWMKLESIERKQKGDSEVRALETEVRKLTNEAGS